MFYLFLLSVFLMVSVLCFGRFHVRADAVLSNNDWLVRVQLHVPLWIMGIGVTAASGTVTAVQLYILKGCIPFRFPLKFKKRAARKSLYRRKQHSFAVKGTIRRIRLVKQGIQGLSRLLSFRTAKIEGELHLTDPAVTGMIFGIIEWLRSFPELPISIQLQPKFVPGKSRVSGIMQFDFRLIQILLYLAQERRSLKPIFSSSL